MEQVKSILVTGANGFVGMALAQSLLNKGFRVRMTGQARVEALVQKGGEWFPMADLAGEVDWAPALEGMDAVVHLAAIAHRGKITGEGNDLPYDQVNHRATRALASAIAANVMVKRFLFISSVRVHGDAEAMPVVESSPLIPVTPYDLSKVNAEKAIRELLADRPVAWAIVRPALVYGPGNRGNMAKLENLLRAGIPVPVVRKPNRRSFLFIGNLVSAIEAFLECPTSPAGRTWIVADEPPASTETLVTTMGHSMGVKVRVLHLPAPLLAGAGLVGDLLNRIGVYFPWTSEVRQKLLGDFFVDISAIKADLGWTPPFSMAAGIAQTYESRDLELPLNK